MKNSCTTKFTPLPSPFFMKSRVCVIFFLALRLMQVITLYSTQFPHPTRYDTCGSGGDTYWRNCRSCGEVEIWRRCEVGDGSQVLVGLSRNTNRKLYLLVWKRGNFLLLSKIDDRRWFLPPYRHDKRQLSSLVNVEHILPYLTSEQL